MILNKEENIENTKSDKEAKGEDEQYGKPKEQCQKHKKVIAAETKIKEKEKENQGDKTLTWEDIKKKNTSKTNKLGIRHFKLHQETLVDKKIEPELKEEQTEIWQKLKEDDAEKKTSSRKNKPKEIALEKNYERERNIGETKPQNLTEDSEKEICTGCNKYVETDVQCGSYYRW